MKIIVYDIAAKKGGGGETILRQYFDIAARQTENEWWFFISIEEYLDRNKNNIHVVFVDVGKSSTLANYTKRKAFEILKLRRIIRDINPDELISLQNMIVTGVTCKQTVYLHQPFQFSPVKYRFIDKNERSLAFRQRVICRMIKWRLSKADKVIVQTEWMRQAVSSWAHFPQNRIVVETPIISIPTIPKNLRKINNAFIYPANAYLHKNHQIIIDACKELKKKGYNNYHIYFTLSPNSGRLAARLYSEVKSANLPIEFIGHLEKEELFEKYQTLVMLFPSYVETFGLPLLEAKSVGGRIIASNLPFSHEILDDYCFAEFVDWNNVDGWASAILKHILM